ncbi:hypothetical protein NDU88_001583 [Pleurodeles waltl]|uniref:Uncharacterized protein n=1 Tax=Pleurodeles waltl TaxID=8319 RepID=A0AAV7L9W9_PLEWA|nr:hypothetical protein NDU88_001583 [Pleurodeles waltl]
MKLWPLCLKRWWGRPCCLETEGRDLSTCSAFTHTPQTHLKCLNVGPGRFMILAVWLAPSGEGLQAELLLCEVAEDNVMAWGPTGPGHALLPPPLGLSTVVLQGPRAVA